HADGRRREPGDAAYAGRDRIAGRRRARDRGDRRRAGAHELGTAGAGRRHSRGERGNRAPAARAVDRDATARRIRALARRGSAGVPYDAGIMNANPTPTDARLDALDAAAVGLLEPLILIVAMPFEGAVPVAGEGADGGAARAGGPVAAAGGAAGDWRTRLAQALDRLS